MKLKLHKSLKSQQFVKDLIQKTIMEVKEIHDVQNYKLNPQLLQDLYVFIQNQIEDSRFSKKKINVIEVLKVVISEVFDLNEQEQSLVETMIEHLVDNKLVKKRGFFSCFQSVFLKQSKKEQK